MSQKAKTTRTVIADLPEYSAVSVVELNQIDGGATELPVTRSAIRGVLKGIKAALGSVPGSVTNPGQTDTAVDY